MCMFIYCVISNICLNVYSTIDRNLLVLWRLLTSYKFGKLPIQLNNYNKSTGKTMSSSLCVTARSLLAPDTFIRPYDPSFPKPQSSLRSKRMSLCSAIIACIYIHTNTYTYCQQYLMKEFT